MYLVREQNTKYSWKYRDKCLFTGTYHEVIAHGHWIYDISKEEIKRALALLGSGVLMVSFKNNKIENNIS